MASEKPSFLKESKGEMGNSEWKRRDRGTLFGFGTQSCRKLSQFTYVSGKIQRN